MEKNSQSMAAVWNDEAESGRITRCVLSGGRRSIAFSQMSDVIPYKPPCIFISYRNLSFSLVTFDPFVQPFRNITFQSLEISLTAFLGSTVNEPTCLSCVHLFESGVTQALTAPGD